MYGRTRQGTCCLFVRRVECAGADDDYRSENRRDRARELLDMVGLKNSIKAGWRIVRREQQLCRNCDCAG